MWSLQRRSVHLQTFLVITSTQRPRADFSKTVCVCSPSGFVAPLLFWSLSSAILSFPCYFISSETACQTFLKLAKKVLVV